MSSNHIVLDTESSDDNSTQTHNRSVVLGLLANNSGPSEPHLPVIRGPGGVDVEQAVTNILELVTDGLRKLSGLHFYQEQLQTQVEDIGESMNQIQIVLEDIAEYARGLRC